MKTLTATQPGANLQAIVFATANAHLDQLSESRRSNERIQREIRNEAITNSLRLLAVPIAWFAAFGATELWYPSHGVSTLNNSSPTKETEMRFDANRDGRLDLGEIDTARTFYKQRLDVLNEMTQPLIPPK